MVEVIEAHEVRVREAGDGSKLTLKVMEGARVRELELLEGELALVDGVKDAVHMTHTACAETRSDLISPDFIGDRWCLVWFL
jgi:hypothetical protein